MTSSSTDAAAANKLIVLSSIDVAKLEYNNDFPVITEKDQRNDAMDDFNHPRIRRALILTALRNKVHSEGLIDFLQSAWDRWDRLGTDGQDPMGSLSTTTTSTSSPPLIPGNVPLPRDPIQRPSRHVLGQIGYYCTDTCTPIFGDLVAELESDAAIVQRAVTLACQGKTVYAIPTHPGHHAARDSFGGYCYVNHAASAARLLTEQFGGKKVAILDIDYHSGNGTASIFYDDITVLVVSIHCDPDHDYPFHSGFADETGSGDADGTTLHLPLPPGTTWKEYQPVLERGLQRIRDFVPHALVVSLGLDTYLDDPCAIRRAGFCLQGSDYVAMGRTIAAAFPPDLPTIFLQEGGYRMDKVGEAAADVVVNYLMTREKQNDVDENSIECETAS